MGMTGGAKGGKLERGTPSSSSWRKESGRVYYGWVVVAVAFLAMFVNYGVRGTQTVLIKGFSKDLGIGRAAASLPFTVSVLIYAFLAPVTGRLIDRFGPRWVMAGGAFLSGVGLWMCSRANSLWLLVLFFGVVFGVGGNGIGLVPSNTSVAMWFRRRLGLALGVATMGIGFGTMILPRLTGLIQSRWDWRASFQFLGYISLALTFPALLLLRGGAGGGEEPCRETAGNPGVSGDEGEESSGGSVKADAEGAHLGIVKDGHQAVRLAGEAPDGGGSEALPRADGACKRPSLVGSGRWVDGSAGAAPDAEGMDVFGEAGGGGALPCEWSEDWLSSGDAGVMVDASPGGKEAPGQDPGSVGGEGGLTLRQALRTASFWYLFMGFVLIVIALYGIMVHQVPYVTDRGISRNWAEWSVFVYGASSILGRVFFGRLSDRTREKKNALYPACIILAGSILLLFLVDRVWVLMFFAAVFGFGFAAYGPVIPAVCAEVFGKASMGAIFGAVTTGGALGGAFGPVLTGYIFDRSGSYLGAWVMALACVILSTLLFSRVRVRVFGDGTRQGAEGSSPPSTKGPLH